MLKKIENKMQKLIIATAKTTNSPFILKPKNIENVYYIYLKRNDFYETEKGLIEEVEIINDYEIDRKIFKRYFDFNANYFKKLSVLYEFYFEKFNGLYIVNKKHKAFKLEYDIDDKEYNLEAIIKSIKPINTFDFNSYFNSCEPSQLRILLKFMFEPIKPMNLEEEYLSSLEIILHATYEVVSLF